MLWQHLGANEMPSSSDLKKKNHYLYILDL